jgi:hypothetical protein
MPLDAKFIPILADATKFYYNDSELMELCTAFEVDLSYHLLSGIPYLAWARSLLQNIDQGNNRRFLRSLVASILSRAREGASRSEYEKRIHHQTMVELILPLEEEIKRGGIPNEASHPLKSPSTSWEEAQEFLARADTEIMIVDDRLGINTFECLKKVRHHIRILTSSLVNPVDDDIEKGMQDFRASGHILSVRRQLKVHDRLFLFNNRCWLSGSSLSEVGMKGFNVIEIVDFKKQIFLDTSGKWEEAAPWEARAKGGN